MHHRRIASFLAGLWVAGSLFMAFVAIQNFRGADRILAAPSPAAAKIIQTLGHDQARMFLRYQAAEENREYFDIWETSQIAIGLILTAVLALGTSVNRMMLIVCGTMILLVVFMHFVLTPEITYIGRNLDFIPPDAGGRSRFWVLHGLYSGLELLKLLLACILIGYLFVFKTKVKPRPLAEAVSLD